MKLILGNNHSKKFEAFYRDLSERAGGGVTYDAYESLVFTFDSAAERPVQAYSVITKRQLTDYAAVYINNYLETYELAVTVATCLDAASVPYANSELAHAPSLSKLTEYARLAAARVRIPRTVAATKHALLLHIASMAVVQFPAVLKRADADRGIDNFKVSSPEEITSLLAHHGERSLWILQEFVEHEGYFRVAYNGGQAQYAVYRTLEARPDGDPQKAHMYKPKGGANASFVERADIPPSVLALSDRAVAAMKREFAGVDCLYAAARDEATIVEVNYNPQIVTSTTFVERRVAAYVAGLQRLQ